MQVKCFCFIDLWRVTRCVYVTHAVWLQLLQSRWSPWENGCKLETLSIQFQLMDRNSMEWGKSTINYSMSHVPCLMSHAYKSFHCNNSTDWIDCLIAHLLITHNARPLVQINMWIIYKMYIYNILYIYW